MNKIFQFLKQHFSKDPKDVNRLFVTAFLLSNRIVVDKNDLLETYVIKENNKQEFLALTQFLDLVAAERITLDFECLVQLFEFVISPEDRIVTGAVYTPQIVRKYIIDKSFVHASNQMPFEFRVADISCGCGGFLLDAARKLRDIFDCSYAEIFKKSIFGLDIQEYSIERTKLLLTLLAVSEGEDVTSFDFNLYCGDALSFEWSSVILNYSGFNVIVGNPPYVCSRNISEKTKVHLKKWEVCSSGHPDLYIPFFQIGLENLSNSGILGFITMNSFFKSVNGRALRKYFSNNTFAFRIIDFGNIQIFKARSTYTCICLIDKIQSEAIEYLRLDENMDLVGAKHFYKLKYADLDSYKGWNLTPENSIIDKIENVGIPFGTKYKTRNGIATLKNNVYVFSPVRESSRYYYLLDGENEFAIEKDICKAIVNPNILASSKNFKNRIEKLIFPYHINEKSAVPFDEEHLLRRYPRAHEYLLTKKKLLATRDKGKGKSYKPWFIFGRNQSLEQLKHKLFFPHITAQIPNFVINSDEELRFYNGIAVIGSSKRDLSILKKILSSRIFWFYITKTSKPYSSSYYSLSKNYIKNFGIPIFTKGEEDFILRESDSNKLDKFFERKYGVRIIN